MPTFEELSSQYAKRIFDAISKDGFKPYGRLTASDLRGSWTLAVLKEIRKEIDGLVYTKDQNPLTDFDKNKIHDGLARLLRLSSYQESIKLTESASNDDFTDLVDTIDNILKGKG